MITNAQHRYTLLNVVVWKFTSFLFTVISHKYSQMELGIIDIIHYTTCFICFTNSGEFWLMIMSQNQHDLFPSSNWWNSACLKSGKVVWIFVYMQYLRFDYNWYVFVQKNVNNVVIKLLRGNCTNHFSSIILRLSLKLL